MKKTRRTAKDILVVASFLVVILSTSFIFISQMNRMIESTTTNTVSEIANHDLISIENFLERNWNELDGVFKRLVTYHCDTIPEVQERMILERSTGGFHTLYLVSEDGTVYMDQYAVYPSGQMDMQSYLGNGRDKIACRYDYRTAEEEWEEMILYAIPLGRYEVEGVRFTHLVGISPINQIQKHMSIYSFFKNGESRGYTSVINPNGDYIVNVERTASNNRRDNLYDRLDRGTRDVHWTNEAIRESMTQKESFQISYTDRDGVPKYLFFTPVEGVTWYLVTVVDQSVFTELYRAFVFSSISMVVIAIFVSLGMLLLLMRFRRSALRANAEAKARSDFLSNMSHEIRTPLNGITGLLHLMEVHLPDGNEGQMRTWIQKANGTAQYLLSLVSDILDMSKLQAGKLTLYREPFLLDAVLDSIESMQRDNAKAHGVELILEKDIPVPCIMGDRTRITQVLMNIVGNAVKFTPEGGSIRLSAYQVAEEHGRVKTTITCADTGIGMSQEFLRNIWDSFSQEHNGASNGMRGTGLGMSISKGIMDAMGGEISVYSELGKGSTFTVSFRSDAAELRVPMGSAATEPESAAPEDPLKLLVAEDNELNSEILLDILRDAGYEAVLAENGKLAAELFERSAVGEFDAILMDMQMPVMDGCQAARAIRALDRPDAGKITIFACTANSFQEDRERAMASGMNDFLTKPVDIHELLAKLAEQQRKKTERK